MSQTPRSGGVFAALLGAFRLDPGFAAAPASRDLASTAAVAFGVSLGLQLTVLAILAVGPLAEPFPLAELTEMGRKNVRPEHDLPAFYVGCVLTVALAWLAVRAAGARLAGRVGAEAERGARRGAAVHAALAAASLVLFAWLAGAASASVGADPHLARATLVRLAFPCVSAFAGFVVDHAVARRRARGRA